MPPELRVDAGGPRRVQPGGGGSRSREHPGVLPSTFVAPCMRVGHYSGVVEGATLSWDPGQATKPGCGPCSSLGGSARSTR
jgi:hypothetical protein